MPRNLSVVAGGTAAVVLLGVVTCLAFREPTTAARPLGGPLVVVVVPQDAPPVVAAPEPAVEVATTPPPLTATATAGQAAGAESPTPPLVARSEARAEPMTSPAPPAGEDDAADATQSASNEYWTPSTSAWWMAQDDDVRRHSDEHHWSTPDPEPTSDTAASRSGERLATEVRETACGSRYGPGAPR